MTCKVFVNNIFEIPTFSCFPINFCLFRFLIESLDFIGTGVAGDNVQYLKEGTREQPEGPVIRDSLTGNN